MKIAMLAAVAMMASLHVQAADIYVRGSFNSWQNSPMSRGYCTPGVVPSISSCVYYSGAIVPGSANHFFKYDRYGDWSVNYGDNNAADAFLDAGGANISLQPQYYSRLAFEYAPGVGTARPTYRVHQDDCGNAGLWGNFYNHTQRLFGGSNSKGDYYCYQTVSYDGSGQLYFTDGAAVYGDTNGDLELEVGTSGAISIPQAGIYRIGYIHSQGHRTYTVSRYGTMSLRGSFNAWGNSAMQMVKPFVWSYNVYFAANTPVALKFDAYGNWATNFGDANGDYFADANATNNITLVSGTSGLFPVRFNETTRRFALCVAGHASYDAQLCN